MDTFAHLLWTLIFFHRTEHLMLALFFGVMPDLFSWFIYMVTYFTSRKSGKRMGKPDPGSVPQWVWTLYGLTHSVFVFAAVFSAVFLAAGRLPYYLLPWLIHIVMDIPTHSKEFLPTPFLWPFSGWRFPGFSWGQKWFMLINYGLIAGIMIWLMWP